MGTATPATPLWKEKVDPWVLENTENGETEFLVYLSAQADLSAAQYLDTKEEKGLYVYEQLTSIAAQTQKPLIANLKAGGIVFKPFWVVNMVWMRGDLTVVEQIARRSDVAHIYANPKVHISLPDISLSQTNNININSPDSPQSIEWNIQLVGAPELWNLGYNGNGAVVGGQDTGYQWDHPALKAQYRGWDGGTADHNYNWHDAIHEDNPNTNPGNPCGFDSPLPCDDHGHGTHTMGTMVGDDGEGHQIGMAPGARWIGCRNMEEGWGSPATYSECYQWFIAPTDLNDENPRPDLAPDVINNSWSCPTDEGCTDPNVLLSVVDNVRAAGIVTVHSAGNSGSSCSTVNTPAAIYDSSFTVGATDSNDNIAGFSSRGPVTIDNSGRMKPDISAPGVGIFSSTLGDGYGSKSGTSMASPHVVGLVALLISRDSKLHGNVDAIERIIRQSAVRLTISQECGGVPGSQIPNNTYGWGRINAISYTTHLPFVQLQSTIH